MKLAALIAFAISTSAVFAAPMTKIEESTFSGLVETATPQATGSFNGEGVFTRNHCEPGGGGEGPVPEPATMALLGLGAGAMLLKKRK